MATVPTYDNLQARPGVLPMVPLQGASGPGAGQIAGEQMQRAGQGLQSAGAQVQQIALAMQEQADRTRVNDAVNKARQAAQDLAYHPETGFLALKGDAALTRPDGKPLVEEFDAKLAEKLSAIGQTLGNDAQREQFAANAADLRTSFRGQASTHLLSEFKSHAISVQDGTIALASDDAKRRWQDPDAIGKALGAAKAAVVEKGRASGWSATQTDAALLATTGKVHTDVVLSALQAGAGGYAQAYLNRHRGEMGADDILRVQPHIDKLVTEQTATGAVQTATLKAMPSVMPSDFDRMVHITAQTESGGRETDSQGRTITSPKGAQGVMQVMPATSKNPGFGVKPAQDDSPEERARVGRDYLRAMLQRYGDPAKAWAAYNAGPDRVDREVKDAAKRGEPGAWLSNLPKETRDYVAQNMGALGSGQGPDAPTELDFVNRALAALPAGASAETQQRTRTLAVQQFATIHKSIGQQAEAVEANAQRWLASNPGAGVEKLPPDIADSLRRLAPGKLDNLRQYAKAIGADTEVKTDLVLYNRLASHPEELARMTDTQFEGLRAHLAPADFKAFARDRAGAQSGGAEAINTTAMNSALTTRLESLGIAPTARANDKAAHERLGGIKQFVRASIFEQQANLGRKMTPEEIEGHLDKLFTASVEMKGVLWGKSDVPVMGLQLGDVPSQARDGLRQALVASGIKAPTNNDILNLYRKLHTRGTN